MRLIDANANVVAIRVAIKRMKQSDNSNWLEGYLDGLDAACNTIEASPTIEAEPVATDTNVGSKWIPVTERLPDKDDMVIAFYPTMLGTSGEMQIHKAWAMSETCTHWMPLPQQPKCEIAEYMESCEECGFCKMDGGAENE